MKTTWSVYLLLLVSEQLLRLELVSCEVLRAAAELGVLVQVLVEQTGRDSEAVL